MGGSEAPLLSETIRAAIYARTSSPSQRFGHSISEQVRQCVQRCQMQGWEVQHVFRDEAKSGKDTDRPMFQQMLNRAKQGVFDVLLFWKLDRFSRSIHHAVRLEKQFREWGVALHSVTEQLDTTTPAGQFNFRNIANAAEFEREMISQRTKMGHAARATEGKWPNGIPPLGYEISSGGRLSIDAEEAELVREIFQKYIKLRSMPGVVDYLLSKENSNSLIRNWTPNTVSILLRNNLYTGRYSVGEVEKQVPEYRIVSDSIFKKATRIRTRFTKGSSKQGTMNRERKQRHIKRLTNQYKEWLNSTE
ncbi:resolvase [Halococcus morrhuae DSM 1307]|uniref:Resolvase n=2 Tax=Halococcus morrhuae TaxID=2250 RepID=M0MPG0_HALMO|nr:resolvase [Halococcus morrhuae DSM 1307]